MERLTERRWTSKDNTTTEPTLVLDNCAHCGGMAEFYGKTKVGIECRTCGIATPTFELKTQAVAVWNRRVNREQK